MKSTTSKVTTSTQKIETITSPVRTQKQTITSTTTKTAPAQGKTSTVVTSK